jgi:RNA polymerase sigma-70 factor (ECF subfamily)
LADETLRENREATGTAALAHPADGKNFRDPEAFRAMFQRFGRPVLSFIYHSLGDRSGAEELTQETFLRAYRGLGSLRDDSRLSTWLFGIARNVVREAIREKRRDPRLVDLDDSSVQTLRDEGVGPQDQLLTGELQRTIRRSLDGLSDDQRAVFVLKMLSRMSYQEISRITGSSVGKLKTDLHRARLQMRERLRPYLGGQDRKQRGGA